MNNIVDDFPNLKKKGQRLTKARKCIFACLTNKPQSVAEIIKQLQKDKHTFDQATVYRTLEYLVDLNVVAKTQFRNEAALFELHSETKHHHHLVCDTCGSIEDISLQETELLGQVQKLSNFTVTQHNLEFFGICGNCQN